MSKLSELKNILYNYINEYIKLEKKEDFLSYNISLYEEILSCLSCCIDGNYEEIITLSICLDTLFGNKYDELLQCIYAKKKLDLLNIKDNKISSRLIELTNEIKEEYKKIKEEYEEIELNIDINKEKMISARRAMSALKYSQTIAKDDMKNINDVLRELNYSDTDISLIIENLFIHNKNVISKKSGYKFQDKYKFLNLLSLGYEKFEYPDVLEENRLVDIATVIINLFENFGTSVELEDYIKLLPVIDKDVQSIEEFEFILIKVLENIRGKLNETIALIKDEDFIMDLESKNEISKDCYYLISLYNLVRDYMDKEKEKYEEQHKEEENYNDNLQEVNNLFYLKNENGKCYLIYDIEKFPLEYLEKTAKLITDFKYNNLSKKKTKRMIENSRTRGFSELKDDQVRVVYKKIKDNDYLIYGAFVKKDNRKYKIDLFNICDRNGDICEDSIEIENELMTYIDENSRKWSR